MEWWKSAWFIQTSYYQRVSKTPQKRAFSERNPRWWISRESQSSKTRIFLDTPTLATASVMHPPEHKDNTSPPNEFGRKGKHAIIAFGNAYILSSRITNSTEQRLAGLSTTPGPSFLRRGNLCLFEPWSYTTFGKNQNKFCFSAHLY